jgi:hypothetical protein
MYGYKLDCTSKTTKKIDKQLHLKKKSYSPNLLNEPNWLINWP